MVREKERLAWTVGFVFMLAFILCAAPAVFSAEVLRYGCVQNIEHVYNKGAQKLANLVAEHSNGQIKIEIYPDSRLGTNPEMMDAVKTGMLAMGQFPPGTLGAYDKRMSILSLYYLFENFDAMRKALRSPAMQKLAEMYHEKTGVRILGYFGGLERNVITRNKPIWSMEDLKGLKMRAWEWKPAVRWWKDLGAIPSVMSFKEVYTGLQTGVVDGAENEFATFDKSKWAEVCKYVARTQHIFTIRPVVIYENRFRKLSENLKKILTESMAEASEYELSLAGVMNNALAEKLKMKYGLKFTEPAKGPFVEISRKLYLDYAEEVGVKDIAAKIIE